ncbi:NAD(P)H-hydrate dehydratase [Sphingosinicella xenopeptidilytica]|uniref:Bifunctional NAD(P)H-hydrate repair enzyme n=1 Tax=Sphingosinicella xenopeptidilytica TaxID=364098 RepID=A0ABW3C6L2_SPHXN
MTATEMRAAEAAAIAAGASGFELMCRAGEASAAGLAAFYGPAPVLVLVGPGNNGGDGYVVANALRQRRWPVEVAALTPPATQTAQQAATLWNAPVIDIADAEPRFVLVDALFGTGLTRGLEEPLLSQFHALARASSVVVSLDLPSGAATDDGTALSPLAHADLTVTFGAMKPSHLLHPTAAGCGRVVVADIGLGGVETKLFRNGAPPVLSLATDTHKYRRGHVVVVSGAMAGAAWLAARAAQRAGAGYVTLASETALPPSSLVVQPLGEIDLARADAVVLGSGLGRDVAARRRAAAVLEAGKPMVLDADIFSLFAADPVPVFGLGAVMTPHEGEFARLFGDLPGSKVDRARAAAARSGNVIVLKGPDTVIAAPDGRAVINDHASSRLATAGSGDVLSGMIAAHLARGDAPFEAACTAVWRHGDAALRGRDGLIAEDLVGLIR